MPPVARGYCRIPLDPRARDASPLDGQREAHRAFHARHLAPLGVAWEGTFADPQAVTGGVPLPRRKAGGELQLRLAAGDHVVLCSLPAAFVSLADAAGTLASWHARGVRVHVLDREGEGDGCGLADAAADLAEMARELAPERAREQAARKRREGRALNGGVPYGKRRVGPRGRRKLADDPREMEAVRQVVRLRDEGGQTFREIARALAAAGVRTRAGRPWSRDRVWRAYRQARGAPPPS